MCGSAWEGDQSGNICFPFKIPHGWFTARLPGVPSAPICSVPCSPSLGTGVHAVLPLALRCFLAARPRNCTANLRLQRNRWSVPCLGPAASEKSTRLETLGICVPLAGSPSSHHSLSSPTPPNVCLVTGVLCWASCGSYIVTPTTHSCPWSLGPRACSAVLLPGPWGSGILLVVPGRQMSCQALSPRPRTSEFGSAGKAQASAEQAASVWTPSPFSC